MKDVVTAALHVKSNAHAPYSKYKVGAAVETEDGTIVSGCNVESSSYGLTACAERVALHSAIAQGYKKFKTLVIATRNGAAPCGACRQIIWELCGNIPITLIDENGKQVIMNSSDLLPHPFDNQSLTK
ncbi:MAG: cytidine deaminase [Candidatus Marinimicrobia bacterium]|nr:cytidine deaminase [Candidatus Neomarinimicrobiota bacterium]